MKEISVARRIAAGVMAAVLMPFAAHASDRQVPDEIVVRSEAPVATEVGRSRNQRPVVLVEAQHFIRVDDLDLTTSVGADALLKRVQTVARKSCSKLSSMFKDPDPDPSCVRDAVKGAIPQIEAAISEAKGQRVAGLSARM